MGTQIPIDRGAGGSCNPNDNIEDPAGIAGNEIYAWRFDLNCDGIADAIIRIADNQLSGSGLFAGATGTFAFRKDDAVGATGHDFEVAVQLLAPLPLSFAYRGVEASALDGLSEDRSDGTVFVPEASITMIASANPTIICAGATTRFTIDVKNTGPTPL